MNEQNVTLLIYGDSIDFKDGVQYDNISEIDKTNFRGDEFLVINDRNSNVLLSDDDYVELKELIATGVTLMYFGDSKLDEFKDNGFYSSYNDCLGFYINAIDYTVIFGLWSIKDEEIYKTNKKLLGQTVVETVVYELKK